MEFSDAFATGLVPSATVTSTPEGTATGALPMRDMFGSLPDVAEDFAAHVALARFAVTPAGAEAPVYQGAVQAFTAYSAVASPFATRAAEERAGRAVERTVVEGLQRRAERQAGGELAGSRIT